MKKHLTSFWLTQAPKHRPVGVCRSPNGAPAGYKGNRGFFVSNHPNRCFYELKIPFGCRFRFFFPKFTKIPRFFIKTATYTLFGTFRGKVAKSLAPEWPHRAQAHGQATPSTRGVGGEWTCPAYGVWWLYTHLDWGTWGTATFFSFF